MITKNLYPNAKKRAVTFSYDDGVPEDERLVEIFNKYGVKGSFHLNSAKFGTDENAREVCRRYAGHEISCHTVNHPFIADCPKEEIVFQTIEDRRRLEYAAGYPVRGMSYPFGSVNDATIKVLDACGIVYSRTVNATNRFDLPTNFLRWDPTCHHNGGIMDKIEPFVKKYTPLPVFYVWGHAYEFPRDNNWELIEEFCAKVSTIEDAWFATNIEIYDYVQALERIYVSADRKMIHNPSAISVWLTVDGKAVEVRGGETYRAE